MAFKCADCNLTYPDKDEQTGTLGQPNYCPDCYEEQEDEEDENDGPNAAVQQKDSDDTDRHPWGGMLR